MGDVFLIGLACGIGVTLLFKYILAGINEIEVIIKELIDKQ